LLALLSSPSLMTCGISAKAVGLPKHTCSLMLVRSCLTSTVDMAIAHQTTGFLIIWSKFSDKVAFISTASIFVIFSGACGASRTIIELYEKHQTHCLEYLLTISIESSSELFKVSGHQDATLLQLSCPSSWYPGASGQLTWL
jgi:hypothetical protein